MKINDKITTDDLVELKIFTQDNMGNPVQPLSVNRLIVTHIQTNFSKNKPFCLKTTLFNAEKKRILETTKKKFLNNQVNEDVVKQQEIINKSSSIVNDLYYTDSFPVLILENLYPDLLKEENLGVYTYNWQPNGLREGNYVYTWTWQVDDQIYYDSRQFTVIPSVSGFKIPSHAIPDDKYKILMDKCLPSMYKLALLDEDVTPEVLEKLNSVVGDGFTLLEDMANQIIDMYDANSAPRSILSLLGNFFDLKLRSDDQTLWRRQIKNAIPLLKKKGTIVALKEALSQAGIKLNKVTRLWQIVSSFTWTDSYEVNYNNMYEPFPSTRIPLECLEVSVRHKNEKEYVVVDTNSVGLYEGKWMWLGEDLTEGEHFKITYKIAEFNDKEDEELDNYIKSLPLSDTRDETKQKYPKKNWNVRLIEEDDLLFDRVIKEKHPFYDPVIFGKVRTIFLYGENIYNMDTFNGSLRDSTRPCDIDRDFIDSCSGGLSSKFNADVEIDNLNSLRIEEAEEIIREFTPFHSELFSLSVCGTINEYIPTPLERIEIGSSDELIEEIACQEAIAYEIEFMSGDIEKNYL